MESATLVSVVTPFYNTREFLAECIESVLRQTYQNREYVLVDNCSTDGSSEIATDYTLRFPGKIRLIHRESFLSQVQNYNFALSCILPNSKYCKMVQADDWLFPDCVRSMVEVAEAHPTVGIVGAYELEGDEVRLDGPPYPSPKVPGRQVGRLHFLRGRTCLGRPLRCCCGPNSCARENLSMVSGTHHSRTVTLALTCSTPGASVLPIRF